MKEPESPQTQIDGHDATSTATGRSARPGGMLTDDELVRGFETGALADFPHAQHVRLTIVYLERHGREATLSLLADGLLRFAASKGHPEKFHVTMTRAWVELIVAARAAFPGAADAAALVAACPVLLDRHALLRFYTAEQLDSDLARGQWVAPDRPLAIAPAGDSGASS